MQALGIIVVKYCVTAKMVADLFTKNVNAVVFERLANVLTGADGTRETLSVLLLSRGQYGTEDARMTTAWSLRHWTLTV